MVNNWTRVECGYGFGVGIKSSGKMQMMGIYREQLLYPQQDCGNVQVYTSNNSLTSIDYITIEALPLSWPISTIHCG
jgi:hypothetical protein